MVWGIPNIGQGEYCPERCWLTRRPDWPNLNRQITNGVVTCSRMTNIVNQIIFSKLSWIRTSFWWCSEESLLPTCANKYMSDPFKVVLRTIFVFYTARGLGWLPELVAQNWETEYKSKFSLLASLSESIGNATRFRHLYIWHNVDWAYLDLNRTPNIFQ